MLYKLGSYDGVRKLLGVIDEKVINDICLGISRLECAYGENFDYDNIGGYSVFVETHDDLLLFKEIVDYDNHLCEWASIIEDSEYISSLFVLNNDFAIVLYLHISIAPESIKSVLNY